MPPIRGPTRGEDMEGFRDTANAFFIAKGPGKAKSAQRLRWREAVYDEVSQIPLEEPGYALRVECKYRPREPSDEPICRTIRVPKDISFHQLHAILGITMQWRRQLGYVFSLWDLPPRDAGLRIGAPGHAEIAKESLVEDVSERMSEYEEADGFIKRQNWKNSKSRKLSQVFGGSRLWQEEPYKIEYEVCCHEYSIQFLGEADVTLDVRPGQEVFCHEGEGQLKLDNNLWYLDDVCIDEGRYATWDKNRVNEHLSEWCFNHRQQRMIAMGRDEG